MNFAQRSSELKEQRKKMTLELLGKFQEQGLSYGKAFIQAHKESGEWYTKQQEQLLKECTAAGIKTVHTRTYTPFSGYSYFDNTEDPEENYMRAARGGGLDSIGY